jgi:valyl-tRNA synthetase
VKLSAERVESYRGFVTKLWNAARFCEMNGIGPEAAFDPSRVVLPLSRWLLAETNAAIQAATDALEAYRFDEYASAAYHFVWNTFCDWFLEFAKPLLATGADHAAAAETRGVGAYVLGQILRLLHPAIPFVTEELWDRFGYGEPSSLIGTAWPSPVVAPGAELARAELDWVVRLITLVRSVRAEMNVPPSRPSPVLLQGASAQSMGRVDRWMDAIRRLARASDISALVGDVPKGCAQAVLDEATIVLPLEGLIDIAMEQARLIKERDKLLADAKKTAQKLANADFISRAPEEVVSENRERLEAAQLEIARLQAALDRLG